MLQVNIKERNAEGFLQSIWKRGQPAVVHHEQAVYGSFPFWDRGYAILAHSPRCRSEWLADLKTACQRFGEPPLGTSASGAMFALRLPSGPWAIVGVGSPGLDDQGRPGALSFHALLLTHREFRKARFNPFALADALRRDWGPGTRALEPGSWPVEDAVEPQPSDDPEVQWTAAALAHGKRVAREAPAPIDDLARRVWILLPDRVRQRASVATLAFATGNHFDLIGVPHLASLSADVPYGVYHAHEAEAEPANARNFDLAGRSARTRHKVWGVAAAAAGLVLLALVAGVNLLRQGRASQGQAQPALAGAVQPSASRAPDRRAYRDEALSAEERAGVTEGLLDIAQRFGVLDAPTPAQEDPAALMILLADRLRYRGPWLDDEALASLAREPEAARADALAWHRQALRFAPDRPLPADFARGPLRWQLDTLVWSFHLDPNPRWAAPEVPRALADRLAVERPIHPGSLTSRNPALAGYALFLGRLPRR